MYPVYLLECLVLVVAIAIGCGTQSNTTVTTCVSDYEELKEETFSRNTQNRQKLLQAFYPPYGHLPYSVIVFYKATFPNGSMAALFTSSCNDLEFVWLSSVIFLYSKPRFLNRLSLFTLNYFEDWLPPNISIVIPYPCPNKTIELLIQMTTLLQSYLPEEDGQANTGIAEIVCRGKNAFIDIPNQYMHIRYRYSYTLMLVFSFLTLQLILLNIAVIRVLKSHLRYCVQQTYSYTYRHYGLMCGVTCCCTILPPVLAYIFAGTVHGVQPDNELDMTEYCFEIIVVSLPAVLALPIAIYFVCKTEPPAVPYIVLIPVAVLCCCCDKKRSNSLVFGIGLWNNLISLQMISLHIAMIFLAMLAEPFAVITNALVLTLVFFCVANIFALLFTIIAYVFTAKHQRPKGGGNIMVRALVLIPLLAMVCCFGLVISSSGYSINVDKRGGNLRSLLGSIVIPVILGVVTFSLQSLIAKWMDKPSARGQVDAIS